MKHKSMDTNVRRLRELWGVDLQHAGSFADDDEARLSPIGCRGEYSPEQYVTEVSPRSRTSFDFQKSESDCGCDFDPTQHHDLAPCCEGHRERENPNAEGADLDEWSGLTEVEVKTISLEMGDQFDAPSYSPYSYSTKCGDPIDVEPAKFRYYTAGLGKCTGSRYDMVYTAFKAAYRRVRAAERDLENLLEQPTSVQKELWHGSAHWPGSYPELSLAYWFGSANRMSFEHRRDMVYDVIRLWSKAFRHGYRSYHKPVLIFCRKTGWLPSGILARHFPRDILDLGTGWFELVQNDRIQVLLHEMGHYSGGSILYPRDEVNPVCTGSWGDWDGDKCYGPARLTAVVPVGFSHPLFDIGDPRRLVQTFEDDNRSYSVRFDTMQDFLNNIDNYVCYMWNRWADRGSCILKTQGLGPAP
ncbi:hypothetical protein ACNOYE_15025 [Nannocystaceae bacterium ST9]